MIPFLTLVLDRRKENPPASCRQGRLEAILEIPQRGYPQEVQGPAADRKPRLQESRGQARLRAYARRRAQEGEGSADCGF